MMDLQLFKDKLLQEKAKLSGISQKDFKVGEDKADLVDQAANDYSKMVSISISTSEREIIGLIDEALERIEDEEFGECKNCQNEISPKRLEAVPWAKYCINCQELAEKGLLDDE